MLWGLQRSEDGDRLSAKRKWYEEKQAKREADLKQLGLGPKDTHRLETAEQAEAAYAKKRKDGDEWEDQMYSKEAASIPYSRQVCTAWLCRAQLQNPPFPWAGGPNRVGASPSQACFGTELGFWGFELPPNGPLLSSLMERAGVPDLL